MFDNFLKLVFSPLVKIYLFIFGRKIFQKYNNFLFLLVIKSMGYSNYGNHSQTGEKKFIELIKDNLEICLDIGANVGTYSKLLMDITQSRVFSFEPLDDAFKDLEKLAADDLYKNRLKIYNIGIGDNATHTKKTKRFITEIDQDKSFTLTGC